MNERLAAPFRPLLTAGEAILVAAPLVFDPGTTDPVSIRDEALNLVDPTALVGLGGHPGELGQRLAFGRAVVGEADSAARRLHDAVGAALSPRLAVTDRRLLVADVRVTPRRGGRLRRWLGPVDERAEAMFAIERRALLGAEPAPAGALRRGRFIVRFADDSTCALVCAVVAHARRAVVLLRESPGGHDEPAAPAPDPGD